MKTTEVTSLPNSPRLYIIMRTDMDSMNPGKAVAQGSHAANEAVYQAESSTNELALPLVREWQRQTGYGFGTAIVLAAQSLDDVRDCVRSCYEITARAIDDNDYCIAGITHDPSYPVKDGRVVHHIPLDTCGYVMCREGSKVHKFFLENSKKYPLYK